MTTKLTIGSSFRLDKFSFGPLKDLEELEIWKRDFKFFPTDLWQLKKLRILALQCSSITSLPPEIGELISLTELHIHSREKVEVSKEIVQLTNLTCLNLKIGSISLPLEIWQLSELTHLNLGFNHLSCLPPEIGQLKNLKELYISRNELTSIANIGLLTNLTSLSLSDNKLTFLPEEIGLLTKLIDLDLSENRITSLPQEMLKLVNLERLYLNKNYFKVHPAEIYSFKAMRCLVISNLSLTFLHKSIEELSSLETLCLNNNSITSLPTEIGLLKNLTRLALYSNHLASLPRSIGMLKISELNLEGNDVSFLPTEIANMNLTKLELSRNKLTSIPTEIGRLTTLVQLDLSANDIQFLPTEIGLLINLKGILNLHANKLTFLPSEIGKLTNVESLFLNWNQLTSIPTEVGLMTKLQRIHINHNEELKELPMSLGSIPSLTEIENYQFYQVRTAILNQCRSMRDFEADNILPSRLDKWKAIAQIKMELPELSKSERGTLNEWLTRLERTRDFVFVQTDLAKTVCGILEGLKCKGFRELFFSQAEANNSCCEDRAAMSLNEIYTSWTLFCAAPHLEEKEKLRLMAGVAKTLYLRKALQKLIPKGERESVEIYLYYETALKEKLQLVTAIQYMAYNEIGQRRFIDQEKLINDVAENFYEELIQLPFFEQFDEITEEFHAKLEECGHLAEEIMRELKMRKIALARKLFAGPLRFP